MFAVYLSEGTEGHGNWALTVGTAESSCSPPVSVSASPEELWTSLRTKDEVNILYNLIRGSRSPRGGGKASAPRVF